VKQLGNHKLSNPVRCMQSGWIQILSSSRRPVHFEQLDQIYNTSINNTCQLIGLSVDSSKEYLINRSLSVTLSVMLLFL